jgi:putative transcriptional regulator
MSESYEHDEDEPPEAEFDEIGESLEGRLLIAMPGMGDPRFDRTLIYLCAHSEDGAMGLVVNKTADNLTFDELLEQLKIPVQTDCESIRVHYGGPVEMGRGFVLHSADFGAEDATLHISDDVCLTATVDILRAMAKGEGPSRSMLALGYAGWAPGQLEDELQRNGWLYCEADEMLLFGGDDGQKWGAALRKIGVDPAMLSAIGGSA